jgi:hypothetical protein
MNFEGESIAMPKQQQEVLVCSINLTFAKILKTLRKST